MSPLKNLQKQCAGGFGPCVIVTPIGHYYSITAMTSINLKTETIDKWMHGHEFVHGCKDISKIYIVINDDETANIKARIPGASTGLARTVKVTVETDGESILSTDCTCAAVEGIRPGYHRCKHVQKVLYRIRDSQVTPMYGPTQQQEQRNANHGAQEVQHGNRVYLAITSKSDDEWKSSKNHPRGSRHNLENFDQKILGVFSSLSAANRCAKSYVEDDLDKNLKDDEDHDLWVDTESDDDMDNEETDDDDQFDFFWESKGEFCQEGCGYEFSIVTKVWVESRALEDTAA